MAIHIESNSSLQSICLLLESYHPVTGGMETQTKALVSDLAAANFRVTVVTRRSDAFLKSKEKQANITVLRVPPVGDTKFSRWLMALTCIPVLIKMRRRYNLVFVSGFRVLGLPAILVAKLFRKTCILKPDSSGEMSGDFFSSGLKKLDLTTTSLPFRFFLYVRNKLFTRADSFISLSSTITKEFISHGIDQHRIHYIPNGVDTRKFHPVNNHKKQQLRRKLSLPQNQTIVTFAGRLVSYKGLPLLLRVWEKISLKYKNTILLVVGSGGSDIHNCESELKEYVKLHNLKNQVYFTGNVRNVYEYLQASDIFVFPSKNEAFPVVLIEAMSCKLPIISTPIAGIKDIIVNKKNGILVDVDNFSQLSDAIELLITDTRLSSSLGKDALDTIKEKYSTDIISKQYIQLFNSFSTNSDLKKTIGRS